VLEEVVLPEVDAPEGSGCLGLIVFTWICPGLVPEVDGVGEKCGVLEEVESLELLSGMDAGAGGGAGGATGGAGFVAGGLVPAPVVPNG
jgi:hypothetical protein